LMGVVSPEICSFSLLAAAGTELKFSTSHWTISTHITVLLNVCPWSDADGMPKLKHRAILLETSVVYHNSYKLSLHISTIFNKKSAQLSYNSQ
jgi:hypothetical protein